MGDHQLYLFEVLIDQIYFQESVKSPPQKKQIIATVKLGNITTLEIRSDTLPSGPGEGRSKHNVEFSAGQSYLAPFNPDQLCESLERHPIEIILGIRGQLQPIGSVSVPWDTSVNEMVQSTKETSGYASPVNIQDNYPILKPDNQIVGNIDMFIRVSPFGESIRTRFEIVSESKDGGPTQKQFIFKDINGATAFSCQRYGPGTSSEIIPIDPVFGAGNIRSDAINRMGINMALFEKTNITAPRGHLASEFNIQIDMIPVQINLRQSQMTFDIVSIRNKPEEERFFNFLTGEKYGVERPSDQTFSTEQEKVEGFKCLFEAHGEVIQDMNQKIEFAIKDQEGPCDDFVCSKKVSKEEVGKEKNKFKMITEPEFNVKKLKGCSCKKTQKTQTREQVCHHILQALELYQKGHPNLKIKGKTVNYSRVIPGFKEKEKSTKARGNDVLRLRGGADEDQGKEEKNKDNTEENIDETNVEENDQQEVIENQEEKKEMEEIEDDTREQETEDVPQDVKEEKDVKEIESAAETKEDEMEIKQEPIKTEHSIELVENKSIQKESVEFFLPFKRLRTCTNENCPIAKKLKKLHISPLLKEEERATTSTLFCGDEACPHKKLPTFSKETLLGNSVQKTTKYCNNKNCPANKMFKTFGLGPLAKEKSLGTWYGKGSVPVVYGITNTYGVWDNYGPYGIFTKFKRPYLTRKEQQKIACNSKTVLRLRGGGTNKNSIENSENKFVKIEKLNTELLRLRGGISKSPILECKEVMEQFDKILGEYRKALGPCGQVACNFTPNLIADSCRKSCEVKNGNLPPKSPQLDNGCGSPECAYTKYKAGLLEPDAMLERQFLPPALTANCGHPRCTYKAELPLPPIHWDCPEPLPKGICKNPDCPYLPKDLKRIRKKTLDKYGPCGSPQCPYKIPPFCAYPACPMRQAGQQQVGYSLSKGTNPFNKNVSYCSALGYQSGDNCDNPDCPFAEPKKEDCDNPNCPFAKPQNETCDNPNCPFTQKESRDACENPNCPFAQKESTDACENPDCPFAKKESTDACDNPNCPFSKRPSNDACENPMCPFRQAEDPCANPDCPFKTLPQPKAVCPNPSCPFEHSFSDECGNPACPYKKMPSEDCIDPECPFKRLQYHAEVCDNPTCPFSKAISMENCRNPNCPYQFRQLSNDSCSNPDCPFRLLSDCKEVESVCSCENKDCLQKGDSTSLDSETCENPECPFNVRICQNPSCPNRKRAINDDRSFCASVDSGCDNPDCPFNRGKGDSSPQAAAPSGPQQVGDNNPDTDPVGLLEFSVDQRQSQYDAAPCRAGTCEAKGGTLRCAKCNLTETSQNVGGKKVCPDTCPGDPRCNLNRQKKLMKKRDKQITKRPEPTFKRICVKVKKKRLYNYNFGDRYPGYKIGHKECVVPYFMVPPKMGWLWNIHTPCMNLKPRRGWRPGAINKQVLGRIQAYRKSKNMRPLTEDYRRGKNTFGEYGDIEVVPKPTLQIKKREGAYYITMNPLKDPKFVAKNEDPYMDCTPMQFKISKVRDNDFNSCVCTEEGEIRVPKDDDSSSDSELDIEFTPPAGIIHPDRFVRKRNVIHTDTQYDTKDLLASKKSGSRVNMDDSKADVKAKKSKDKTDKGGKGKKKKKK